ncbi:MAG: PilW family protein [Gammaproteobacteria bacterium]|nr:PilW family protein [Gammaproteobacteria bacterium]
MTPSRFDISSIHRQRGLSLVELMVAITISLILLAGVVQIFLSSKTSYRLLEATSRVQENGRFAVGFITEDVRMAGYRGCYRDTPANIEAGISSPTSFNWDYATAIQGNEWTGAAWSPGLNALVAGQVVNGSDVLITRGLADDGVNLTATSTSTQIFASDTSNITNGDIMIVSDCTQSSVFQVTSQTSAAGSVTLNHATGGAWTPGNASSSLARLYGVDAQVGRLVTNVYYIGTGASGSPALFRQSTQPGGAIQAQELAEDVENMQVLYGEDTDNDGVANRYVTANNVGTWNDVVSVRVSLLIRSEDNISSSAQTYTYNDTETTAADRRVRRIFNTTIKIRNRGLL